MNILDLYKVRDYHGILDEVTHEIRTANMMEWAEWVELSFKDPDKYRRVGRTEINNLLVSTVFLTINHAWVNKGEAQWFETMLFKEGGKKAIDGYCWRYATWDEASKGHETVVEMVRGGLVP
jgi:hypothetical protein